MQYPIIDNLIFAYQRNGWTGLEIIESKNLLSTNIIQGGVGYETGVIIETPLRIRTNDFIELKSGTYTLSYNETNIQVVGYVYVNGIFNEEYSFRQSFVNSPYSFTVPVDFSLLLAFRYNTNTNITPENITNVQIEKGTEATPYEPYAPPTTDIKNRLKLPMIHYFPHHVIDALISAADGQQTAEENEILRHYLTPLGIGGI